MIKSQRKSRISFCNFYNYIKNADQQLNRHLHIKSLKNIKESEILSNNYAIKRLTLLNYEYLIN